MTQAPDTLLDDLLTRVLAIALDTPGIADGGKVYFELPHEPYPRVVVFYGPVTIDYISGSYDALVLTAQLTIRLLGGSLMTGVKGENEDRLNQTLFALINRFARAPYLQDPATGAPFDYLSNTPPPRLVRLGGITGINYGNPAAPDVYLGTDCTLDVRLVAPRV
jgi:hypothetical protein